MHQMVTFCHPGFTARVAQLFSGFLASLYFHRDPRALHTGCCVHGVTKELEPGLFTTQYTYIRDQSQGFVPPR